MNYDLIQRFKRIEERLKALEDDSKELWEMELELHELDPTLIPPAIELERDRNVKKEKPSSRGASPLHKSSLKKVREGAEKKFYVFIDPRIPQKMFDRVNFIAESTIENTKLLDKLTNEKYVRKDVEWEASSLRHFTLPKRPNVGGILIFVSDVANIAEDRFFKVLIEILDRLHLKGRVIIAAIDTLGKRAYSEYSGLMIPGLADPAIPFFFKKNRGGDYEETPSTSEKSATEIMERVKYLQYEK